MNNPISPNLGMDLVRVTEAAALTASRWMGAGKPDIADNESATAMFEMFKTLEINGRIVIGEEGKLGVKSPLSSGEFVGSGSGPRMDVVADPIEGTQLLSVGKSDSISVAAIAPTGSLWSPYPAVYMEKIVVDKTVADALVEEAMDAPIAWTLALIARVKQKPIRNLVVYILDRPRHENLIREIRQAGAKVVIRSHGDIAGAIMAASDEINVDVLLGIGGVAEGVISACAIKSMGAGMLGRLAPQSEKELMAVQQRGLDLKQILTSDQLATGCDIFFAATGITDGALLDGVKYHGDHVTTESMILRCQTSTKRIIHAEHKIEH